MKTLLEISIFLFCLLCNNIYSQSIQDFQNRIDQIQSIKPLCHQGICQDSRIAQAKSLYTSLKTSGFCINDIDQQTRLSCIRLLNTLSFYYPETHILNHLLKLTEAAENLERFHLRDFDLEDLDTAKASHNNKLIAKQLKLNQKITLATQIRLREFPYVFASRDFPYIKDRAALDQPERGILLSQQPTPKKSPRPENAFLLANAFRLPKIGQFIVVVSSPLCGPSRRFRQWLDNHPDLLSIFEQQALWITPIEDRLYFPEFVQYNHKHPTTPIHYIHQFGDWPEIQLWSTPVLYFFNNGELIDQTVGFRPQDKQLLVSKLTTLGLVYSSVNP